MTDQILHCPYCGTTGRFELKSGRQFLTLFFLVPVLPLGGRQLFAECPRCKAQLEPPRPHRRAA